MIILEGTDAVGKSSVINNLNDYKLLDRDKKICKLFDFNVSLIDRVNKLNEYLNNNKNYIIILVNNDKEELERRVDLRDTIDEYDRYTYLYNLLYLETYIYMEKNDLLRNRIFLVDCTGLTLEEQTNRVKEIVDEMV